MNIIETSWNWKGSLSNRSSTKYIALHHAAAVTCGASDVDSWHKANGWCGIGYHFFVRKDGSVYRGRPLNSVGAHVSGMNSCSIGICAEGNYDTEKTMPTAQKTAIAELLDYLKTNYYPNAVIVGHREIGASDCPGTYYPLDELKIYKNILNESEDTIMSKEYEELKQKNEAQDDIINQVGQDIAYINATLESFPVYDYIDDNMPDWARPTITKLVSKGFLQGDENGKLGLTEDLMRMLVINDRAGVYGE